MLNFFLYLTGVQDLKLLCDLEVADIVLVSDQSYCSDWCCSLVGVQVVPLVIEPDAVISYHEHQASPVCGMLSSNTL